MDVALICNNKENYLAKLDVVRAQRSLKHEELASNLENCNISIFHAYQSKQVLKDPMQFSKFRYGRGVIILYWMNQFLK
jgi:hypothetical protein